MFLDFYNVSMEKTTDYHAETSSSPFFISIDFFLFHKLATWVSGKSKFFSHPQVFPEKNSKLGSFKKEEDGEKMSREEVKMVMGSLGIFCSDESLPSGSIDEVSKLFDEEPSIEEVKEAFDVFDVNRDGFIDAMELQRVLCVLGLKEGEKIGNCEKMIESFDENGDGRIDFDEFAKFMESAV